MSALCVQSCGPAVTLQDQGRLGLLGQGISRGGAMDLWALYEGAALLSQSADLAALEMAGFGGTLIAKGAMRIALTGAEMPAQIDGVRVAWNASHGLSDGQRLDIGAAQNGAFGYLSVGGGFAGAEVLGAKSAHIAAGLGRRVAAGDLLECQADPGQGVGRGMAPVPRFGGGDIRLLPSMQTSLFSKAVRARFEDTVFRRDIHGNRMGVKLNFDGAAFGTDGQLNILSEIIVPGDIQMTGEGVPFVLLNECQTTGGYPRIGTVIPSDLPKVAQALPGAELRFSFVTRAQALAALEQDQQVIAELRQRVHPLIRDPHEMADLLSYNLIGGVVWARR